MTVDCRRRLWAAPVESLALPAGWRRGDVEMEPWGAWRFLVFGPEEVWGSVTVGCVGAADGFMDAMSRIRDLDGRGLAVHELPVETIGDRTIATVRTFSDELEMCIVWRNGGILVYFVSHHSAPDGLSRVSALEATAQAIDAVLDR